MKLKKENTIDPAYENLLSSTFSQFLEYKISQTKEKKEEEKKKDKFSSLKGILIILFLGVTLFFLAMFFCYLKGG